MERTGGDVSPDRTDRDLVLAFKAGERAAYDEMYARYFPRVYGVCSRILRNKQDAEEASQETFLRAYQALHRFNGRYQLGAWLARIAANASVDQLRSKSRAPVVGLPNEQEPVSTDSDPEKLVIGEYPRLNAAIGGVKPLHAQALALRALEGMTHQEIADRLSMSPAQVKALLHRARNSLKRAWDRAEGWLLAPVFSLRALLGERSDTQAGSPLLSAGGVMSPLLAERVATTALVVAVALGGFPTPPPSGAPSLAAEPQRSSASSKVEVRPASPHRVVAAATTGRVTSVKESGTVDELSRLLEDTLKGHTHFDTEKKRRPRDEENDVPTNVTKTTTKLLRQAGHLLPKDDPGSSVPKL